MRASTLFSLALASLAVPALAEHQAGYGHRHSELARRARGDLAERGDSHTGCRFTYYATGLGSCGITNNDNDFIVALNAAEYGSGYPGPNCFKMIRITIGGKSTTAQITDRCPGCPYGGLDFSPGLFKFFADESAGVLTGDWSYVDEAPAAPAAPTTTSSKWVAPTTTSSVWTPDPTTSSVWVAPTTSSTWKPDPTTSSTSQWVAPTTSSTPTPDPTTSSAAHTTPSSSHQPSSSAAQDAPQSSSSADAAADPAPSGASSAAGAAASGVVSNNSNGQSMPAAFQAVLGMAGLAASAPQAS